MKRSFLVCKYITHDQNGACLKIGYRLLTNTPPRCGPCLSSQWLYLDLIFLLTMLLSSFGEVQSLFQNENDALLPPRRDFIDGTMKQRMLQSEPVTSPLKAYAAIRINAGGETEYIDTNGISWGADNWYGNKGRRTTPSECTTNIINTTDDILYCSNRFYPTSTVNPPYRYNIPLPYSAFYEIRLHFAEVVR